MTTISATFVDQRRRTTAPASGPAAMTFAMPPSRLELGLAIAGRPASSPPPATCSRFLLDLGALDEAELQRLARLALSTVTPAPQAGAWVEGVLQGGGLALLHQDGLWQALDGWLSELAPEEFIALLPLLRRSFSELPAAGATPMGEKVKKLRVPGGQAQSGDGDMAPINRERADLVLPVLAQILGGSDA